MTPSRIALPCLLSLAALSLTACARNPDSTRKPLRQSLADTVGAQPDHWRGSTRERYRLAYILWDVDLRELISRIPGRKPNVDRAFDRLRSDLVTMRDLLKHEAKQKAAALVDDLDAVRARVIRARDPRVAERLLSPVQKAVSTELDPQALHWPED